MTSPWPLVELSQVAEVQRGTMITRKTSQEGSIPVIAGGLGPAYFHSDSNRPPGTITVSGSGANAGYVSFWSTPIFASDCSTVITKNVELISQEFLFVFLKSNQEHIMTKLRQGAAQPHVYPKDIQKLLVPIPPLDEQKRIVAKLDVALGVVEDLKANTAQAKSELDALWQSALMHSFSGDWPMTKLGEVSDFERGLTYSKSDEASFSPVAVLRANNVDLETGKILTKDLRYLRDDFEVPPKKLLKANAILVCTASGSKSHLGKVALNVDLEGYAFGGFMGQVTANNNLDSWYLYLNLVTPKYKEYILNLTDGANINNLKWSQLSEFEIPLPPLDEQKRIVAKLDAIKNELDRQREILEAKELETERLRSSILTAAFNGEF